MRKLQKEKIQTIESLTQALSKNNPDEVLMYNPAGSHQISLIQRKGNVVYYCDLNRRPPSLVVLEAIKALNLNLQNINARQRNADFAAGMVPTLGPLSLLSAMKKMNKTTTQVLPTPLTKDRTAPPHALSRVLSTLFRSKTPKTVSASQPSKVKFKR